MNNKRGNVNLSSCTNCGLVVDLKNIKYIPIELPDNPKEDEKDRWGNLVTEDVHFNPNLIWPKDSVSPLDTWECPLCGTFNANVEEC
jgi:hypothetical protein